MPRTLQIAGLLLLAMICAAAGTQSSPQPTSGTRRPFPPIDEATAPPALVRSIRMVPGADGPAVEIITTRPLLPIISILPNPARLVVDLPKSYIGSTERLPFRDQQVHRVRIDQFQTYPPIVRLVFDLLKPASYSWDAAGNRLMIRLRPPDEAPPPTPTVAAFTEGAEPATGEPGTVLMAGNRPATGSVTAGVDPAIMRLARGGEVRVCPGTTVSVITSQDGQDLMLGMSTGALETRYRLNASTDAVLTPDFRILMAGPGEFNYAFSSDSRGNTCVRALPGNTASAIVSELMGNGVYQVKPSEQVVFRAGQIAKFDAAVPADCGCPSNSAPVMRASTPPSSSEGDAGSALGQQAGAAMPGAASVLSAGSETAALPASHPNDIHVQVDAPFVFRASDLPPASATNALQGFSLARPSPEQSFQITVLPPDAELPAIPAAQTPPPHRTFLGKVKTFFVDVFR